MIVAELAANKKGVVIFAQNRKALFDIWSESPNDWTNTSRARMTVNRVRSIDLPANGIPCVLICRCVKVAWAGRDGKLGGIFDSVLRLPLPSSVVSRLESPTAEFGFATFEALLRREKLREAATRAAKNRARRQSFCACSRYCSP